MDFVLKLKMTDMSTMVQGDVCGAADSFARRSALPRTLPCAKVVAILSANLTTRRRRLWKRPWVRRMR